MSYGVWWSRWEGSVYLDPVLLDAVGLRPAGSGADLVGCQVELFTVHDVTTVPPTSSRVLFELQRCLAGNGGIPTEQ